MISIPINGPTHLIIPLQRKLVLRMKDESVNFFGKLAIEVIKLVIENFKKLLSRHIVQYSVASTDNAAFIIGGYDQNNSGINIIAKFQDNEWTRYGSLKATRRLHGSITSGDLTIIVGGDYSG